ncbi:aminoglycoside phosphotransferase family protein [Kribbella sp. NBC_00662]|uniref:phosphotransferase n=1 Tax=Kribbella sp. NBC_00662 TaxID=2975969 RepID=UPI00325236D3
MEASEGARATDAAKWIASSCGLVVEEAVVLHNSNKLALRLLPCDVMARVAPVHEQNAQFEIDIAQQLVEFGSPMAALEPRVEPRIYERDGFVVTLWTYYESVAPDVIAPVEYADALERLHAGMRKIDIPSPRYTDRIAEAQELVANRESTPELSDEGRELLGNALRYLRRTIGERGGAEQLLHGEPHPGNLLNTKLGPLFIDLETCCRGPIEFDLAHAPEEVTAHYPNADQDLVDVCRILVLAMITTWRWDRADQFPNGRQLGLDGLDELREALDGVL